jgi:predicted TIM-barrel fold metal-dependent hydrolase
MIIDFHAHIFPDKIAGSTVSALSKACNIPSFNDGKKQGLLDELQRANVDIAINLPIVTNPKQFDSITRFALTLNAEFVGKGIYSFAGAHPAMDDVKGKMRFLREQGFKGIKLHPDYQGTFFDDDGYVEIVKQAKENDLIVVTHAGLDGAYKNQPIKCTPQRVKNLLKKVGGYEKLVLAHLGGMALYGEVYENLAGENVYFDTAYILCYTDKEKFCKMMDRHGEDKILFATDSPWQNIKTDVDVVRGFGLSKATEDKIFYKNAQKLLGIKE